MVRAWVLLAIAACSKAAPPDPLAPARADIAAWETTWDAAYKCFVGDNRSSDLAEAIAIHELASDPDPHCKPQIDALVRKVDRSTAEIDVAWHALATEIGQLVDAFTPPTIDRDGPGSYIPWGPPMPDRLAELVTAIDTAHAALRRAAMLERRPRAPAPPPLPKPMTIPIVHEGRPVTQVFEIENASRTGLWTTAFADRLVELRLNAGASPIVLGKQRSLSHDWPVTVSGTEVIVDGKIVAMDRKSIIAIATVGNGDNGVIAIQAGEVANQRLEIYRSKAGIVTLAATHLKASAWANYDPVGKRAVVTWLDTKWHAMLLNPEKLDTKVYDDVGEERFCFDAGGIWYRKGYWPLGADKAIAIDVDRQVWSCSEYGAVFHESRYGGGGTWTRCTKASCADLKDDDIGDIVIPTQTGVIAIESAGSAGVVRSNGHELFFGLPADFRMSNAGAFTDGKSLDILGTTSNDRATILRILNIP